MVAIQTQDLIGAALDWAVAKASQPVYSDAALVAAVRGGYDGIGTYHEPFNPSTHWSQGGPIINREAHNLFKHNGGTEWCCACNVPRDEYTAIVTADGPTPLIAAMRCFVASKLGPTVEVPEELVP